MNLVIDRGNTLIKIAFYHDDACLDVASYKTVAARKLHAIIDDIEARYPLYGKVKTGIISSVVKDIRPLIEPIKKRLSIIELTVDLPLPVKIRYKTPKTLGNDRIALSVGAAKLFPDMDVLVIDSGTCITYDLTTWNREYLGGAISPGIGMRFRALNKFTGNLPLITAVQETPLIGDSTENSIRSGVINGVYKEVEGIIAGYKKQVPRLIVVFTGGDMKYFEKYTKSDIFAVSNLVLNGLNEILQYNFKN